MKQTNKQKDPETQAFILEMGYIYLVCRPEEPHGIPETTKSISKAIGCSLQIDYSVLVQNTTPPKFIEHGKFELVMTYSLHPYR